jgi:hypothetical protein
MSYSYVKTVFPNFEYSNVYNDKLYSDMNGTPKAVSTVATPTVTHMPMVTHMQTATPLPVPAGTDDNVSYLRSEPLIIRPGDQTKLIEATSFKEPFINKDKDNLHFYNQKIETFRNDERTERHDRDDDHDEHMKHLSKCEFCKSLIQRQYSSEQTMELISHVALGIFILVLLDTIKK